MEALKYRNRLRRYLRFPLYMLIIFLIGCIVVSFLDKRIAGVMSIFVLIYGFFCGQAVRLSAFFIQKKAAAAALKEKRYSGSSVV